MRPVMWPGRRCCWSVAWWMVRLSYLKTCRLMLILIVVCWIIGCEFDDGFSWSFFAELLIVNSGIVSGFWFSSCSRCCWTAVDVVVVTGPVGTQRKEYVGAIIVRYLPGMTLHIEFLNWTRYYHIWQLSWYFIQYQYVVQCLPTNDPFP